MQSCGEPIFAIFLVCWTEAKQNWEWKNRNKYGKKYKISLLLLWSHTNESDKHISLFFFCCGFPVKILHLFVNVMDNFFTFFYFSPRKTIKWNLPFKNSHNHNFTFKREPINITRVLSRSLFRDISIHFAVSFSDR